MIYFLKIHCLKKGVGGGLGQFTNLRGGGCFSEGLIS